MSDQTIEDRLRASLLAVATTPVPAAAPVDLVVAGARRRQRRARAARTALVVVLVLALLGALGAERRQRIGNQPDRMERIIRNSNTMLPTWLPSGMSVSSVGTTGPETPTTDPAHPVVVFTDQANRERQLVVDIGPPGAPTVSQELIDEHLVPLRIGDADAGVVTSRPPMITVFWSIGDRPVSIEGYAVTLPEVRALGESLVVNPDGSLRYTVPAGMRVDYEGPQITDAPSASFSWSNPHDGTSLSIETSVGPAPFVGPLEPADHITVPGLPPAWIRTTDSSSTVGWSDTDGRQHRVSAYGLTRATLLRIVASLRPAEHAAWVAFRDDVPPESLSDEPPGPTDPPGSASEASTASSVPAADPPPTDVGAVDDVPVGGYREIALVGRRIERAVVVRVQPDRWVGLNVANTPGAQCPVTPVLDGARVVRWEQACATDRAFAPDGSCLAAPCFAGLETFAVRVENGRVIADLSRWRFGVPGPGLTGG